VGVKQRGGATHVHDSDVGGPPNGLHHPTHCPQRSVEVQRVHPKVPPSAKEEHHHGRPPHACHQHVHGVEAVTGGAKHKEPECIGEQKQRVEKAQFACFVGPKPLLVTQLHTGCATCVVTTNTNHRRETVMIRTTGSLWRTSVHCS